MSGSRRIDRHWLRATLATLVLVGLVVAGLGTDLPVALVALAMCGTGFGFFYLMFPGGSHFGVTMANALAVYACLFAFFRDANFTHTSPGASTVALALPVLAFLSGCVARRQRIAGAIIARRREDSVHLPRMGTWVPVVGLVGASSFALPAMALSPQAQDAALVAAMSVIGVATAIAARPVVILLLDVALVFESVTARLDRLLMPVMAFLTFYSLLVIIFACFYRIAEASLGVPQFLIGGRLVPIGFGDALYFSVVTIATVGYGDITPHGPLVRGLAAVEVVLGLLLLLFGFSEIMRTREDRREDRRERGR